LGNVSTAFQTQQGSAFVAGVQGDPATNTGGGFWVRGIGGRVDTKSTSNTNIALNFPGAVPGTDSGTVSCASDLHQTFAGIQLGQDIARTNFGNGWTVTLGTTAGYLEAHGTDRAPASIKSTFEVPFVGTYLVATRGAFFADVMVRREFYNVTLNQPGLGLFRRRLSRSAAERLVHRAVGRLLLVEDQGRRVHDRRPARAANSGHRLDQRHRQQDRPPHLARRTVVHVRPDGVAAVCVRQRLP
jgi:hypothetical protein